MILLTGASGFIGKHLLNALVKKHGRNGVIALTSSPIEDCPYIIHNNYSFNEDVFQKEGYADHIDTIIHAGSFTPKDSSQANDWRNCSHNVYTITKLLGSILPKLNKVIYFSTLDVYGPEDVISELSSIIPMSLYGDSKFYIEKLISRWAESNNAIFQILRIGHVYGPGEEAYQKIIPVTMRKLLLGEHLELRGDGSDLRAFIYIDDVVQAVLNALFLKEYIGPVNLVSNHSISIKELILQIIAISGKDAAIKSVPTNVIPRSLVFDNSKMLKYLLSSESPLIDGLKKEWKYMQNLY